jgi:hypothetical protein
MSTSRIRISFPSPFAVANINADLIAMIVNGEIEVDDELRQVGFVAARPPHRSIPLTAPSSPQLAQRAMESGVVGTVSPKMQQDESGRRQANLEYERERLEAAGQGPITGAEWQALFRRHGFEPERQLSDAMAHQPMSYDVFTSRIVSCRMLTTYAAQGQPDAPRKCDHCNVRGATMRCSNCGEYYCSADHARRDWSAHREICWKAGPRRPRTVPPTMDEEDYAVRVLGKPPLVEPRPVTATAAAAAAAPLPAAVAAAEPAPGMGKNSKKNKKKREKAKAAKPSGVKGSGADEEKEGGAGAGGFSGAALSYENVD